VLGGEEELKPLEHAARLGRWEGGRAAAVWVERFKAPTLRLRGGRAGSMAQTALDGALEDAASAAISSALAPNSRFA